MPTVGSELKRLREERGIALSEIAESTKIGTRFLKAIEEGNFRTLPGGIFTRSFIRAYAKAVGMEEDQAIALYQSETSESGPLIPSELASGAEPEKAAPTAPLASYNDYDKYSKSLGPAIAVAVVLVVFVVVVVFVLARKWTSADDSRTVAMESQSSSAQSSPPPNQKQKPTSTSQTSTAGASAGASQQPSTEAGTAQAQPPAIPSGQSIAVSLQATDSDSWVGYQIDDAKRVALTLKPGESTTLPPANDHVKLNLGNRTGLKIKINDREANFPADTPDFAATLIISRDNLQNYFQPPVQN